MLGIEALLLSILHTACITAELTSDFLTRLGIVIGLSIYEYKARRAALDINYTA